MRRLVLSNAQISAASWQRTNIDGVNACLNCTRSRGPTLVVSGRYDRLTPPAVAHEIHDALHPDRRRLHVFERSAHRPWVEQPEEYVEVVEGFLAGGTSA